MNKRHKDADVIHAWAEGKEIQFYWQGEWTDFTGVFQACTFTELQEWRIKPEPNPEGRMIDQDLFAQWQQDLDERLTQIHAEIDRCESYLRCLRQLKDAAMLSSYPGGFKSKLTDKPIIVDEWKEET